MKIRTLVSALAAFLICFGSEMAGATPVISGISAPRQSVVLGQNLTLNVTATTDTPASFQWRRNGVSVPGATGSSYSINEARPSRDGGWYQVVVTNSSGTSISPVVFVSVVVSPALVVGLGLNTDGQITIPAGLSEVSSVKSWSAHSLALKSDGTVAGWGGTTLGRIVPAGLSDVVAIAAGSHHSLALKSDGNVVGWGRDDSGQASVPARTSNVVAIEAGSAHSLALKADGSVVGWGYGQISIPPGLANVTAISAGGGHSLALKSDGTVVAWGDNSSGQATVPAGLGGVVAVAAGNLHSLALRSDGSVVAWGDNSFGQSSVPSNLSGVVSVAATITGSLALKSDRTAVAWGSNNGGQVTGLSGITKIELIAAGNGFNLVVRDATTFSAPTIASHPSPKLVTEGEKTLLSVAATGSVPLRYQWWKNGAPVIGATDSVLAIEATRASDAGSYSVTVSNLIGAITSNVAALTVRTANPGRLANLSIRTTAGSGSGVLIVGFSLGGTGTTGSIPLLTRVSGPALAQFGVSGTLPDPFLSLYDGGLLVGSNDNWGGVEAASSAASAVGAFAFPATSNDAALISSLPGSGYTAQAFDTAGASGVALVEVYDTSSTFSYTKPRLINLSARATAGSGGSTMIAGFFVKGETALTVLIRGIGPALTQFGVSGVLVNPRLALFRDSTLVAVNENWGDQGASAISSTAASVGAFALPTGSLDSAILATLQPGSYTVQVSSVDNSTGVALIEVYEVP